MSFVALASFLVACAAPPRVPVEERSVLTVQQEMEKRGGQLIRHAQPGDTLYAMAFIAQVDVDTLAAWNQMQVNDALRVGQRIRLTQPLGFSARKQAKKQRQPTPTRPSVATNTSQSKAPSPAKDLSTQTLGPSPTGSSQTSQTQTPVRAPVAKSPAIKIPSASSSSRASFAQVRQWTWPMPGRLLRNYNPKSGQQGIDIAAGLGTPVSAAGAGQVVYSGSSLKGYGHLIIVKHNEEYLSAYAHTQSVKVKEGDWVQQNQALAKVGLNNQGRAALHFQIRRHGAPINPLNLLPKRRG